ncbi:MAG: efflux RND transporter permease subunit, partial [Gammaproteobacteria bacterium]|nr:efflux RND transporter permease subunit [Gammaproteobacteria bacterium]
ETSQAEPDAHQLKYWARGVGNIRVGWKGEGEKTQENLELVEMIRLDSETLAEVRAKALELEKHAYEISNHVYSLMPPVVLLAQIEEERQAARNSMIGFGLTAAIGIFLLLQVFFRSWRLATVIFLTLPMALVGGVLAAFAGGGIISLGSIVGFVTVLGIAVRNCITLIGRYQNLERYEGETFGPELVLRGTRERFAPILMTAATTGLVFLPLALFGDIPGLEIVRPMAVVILGGLVTSTLLNLHVVPAMYLRFGASREPDLELLPAKAVDAMI